MTRLGWTGVRATWGCFLVSRGGEGHWILNIDRWPPRTEVLTPHAPQLTVAAVAGAGGRPRLVVAAKEDAIRGHES